MHWPPQRRNNGVCVAERGTAASLMLMKRVCTQIPHGVFFFSEVLGILLGCPCGSGTNLGVLANIFSFLQALSLDPLQVVMELKLEEPCLSEGDVPMPGVGLLERSTKVLRCGRIQGKWSKANPTCWALLWEAGGWGTVIQTHAGLQNSQPSCIDD